MRLTCNKNVCRESILCTLSELVDENGAGTNRKTVPRFKKDLADLWNDFEFDTQAKILTLLPESWKWDIHNMITKQSKRSNI